MTNAYNSFCETSRHLTEDEYLAFTQGFKTVDTSIGLINIVSEYFLIKDKLNEFIKTCPKTSLIIKLIDTSSFILRLDLIFKVFSENLSKFDAIELRVSRKRKLNDDGEQFHISSTNTSTPETVHVNKRQRMSFSKPLVCLSSAKKDTKVKVDDAQIAQSKKELNYISSTPETSNKEEDDVTDDYDDDDEESSSLLKPPPPEVGKN